MLRAFGQAFRTPDLRRKIFFTLAIMAIYRLGTFIPAPGVSYRNLQQCLAEQDTGGIMGMINLFSGGGMLQLSVFALGIMPYITSSIIIQLMRVVIPRFEELHKEGQTGTAKLTQYTRYVTIFLAVLQSSVIVTLASSGNLFQVPCPSPVPDDSPGALILMIVAMTAGTGLVMWLGELITDRGVGNGMSLLIFTSICASFPTSMFSVLGSNDGVAKFIAILALVLVVTLLVVFVEQAQRRVPVQYAKRMIGRRMYGGSSTYIPIKINMSGVIPVIFASSLLALPMLVTQFADPTTAWAQWIQANLVSPSSPLHIALYSVLILFFAFFYTSITFNPDEVADNMKRYGGFIPGIRAGRPTAEYLQYVITRVTFVGAIYLTLVALIPQIVFGSFGITQIAFGGTSILIVVGVGLQTVKEIESQLQQRNYEGFLS